MEKYTQKHKKVRSVAGTFLTKLVKGYEFLSSVPQASTCINMGKILLDKATYATVMAEQISRESTRRKAIEVVDEDDRYRKASEDARKLKLAEYYTIG